MSLFATEMGEEERIFEADKISGANLKVGAEKTMDGLSMLELGWDIAAACMIEPELLIEVDSGISVRGTLEDGASAGADRLIETGISTGKEEIVADASAFTFCELGIWFETDDSPGTPVEMTCGATFLKFSLGKGLEAPNVEDKSSEPGSKVSAVSFSALTICELSCPKEEETCGASVGITGEAVIWLVIGAAFDAPRTDDNSENAAVGATILSEFEACELSPPEDDENWGTPVGISWKALIWLVIDPVSDAPRADDNLENPGSGVGTADPKRDVSSGAPVGMLFDEASCWVSEDPCQLCPKSALVFL
jgi:hypothetical protein